MKTSPLPNNYMTRLIEKLQQQVAVQGAQSPAAEELERLLKSVEGVTPQKRAKRDTENPEDLEK